MIKEKINKLQEIIAEKREGLRTIEIRILSLLQQQQGQAPKKWSAMYTLCGNSKIKKVYYYF